MGKGHSSEQRSPKCVVWERHSRALYINLPIAEHLTSALAFPPHILPDIFNGTAWLSVVIDDLDLLKAYIGNGMFISTGMYGWMTKCNLLVKGAVPDSRAVAGQTSARGYQILSIFFERGLGGTIKVDGARRTQRIPAAKAIYEMSDGPSRASNRTRMAPGVAYSANVSLKDDSSCLIKVEGTLSSLTQEERTFAQFVVERPHKFLVQDSRARATYAPEGGPGASFSADEVIGVSLSGLEVPILRNVLGDAMDRIDCSKAVCLFQPQYILVDHENLLLGDSYDLAMPS